MNFQKLLLSVFMGVLVTASGMAQDKNSNHARVTDEINAEIEEGFSQAYAKSQQISLNSSFTIGGELFEDENRNFVPTANLQYAGDVNSDGYDDFYYVASAGDYSTEDLSDRISKMVVFYGSEDGISLENSELIENSLTFLTDLNDDGITESIEYENGVLSLNIDGTNGNLDNFIEVDLLEINGLQFKANGDFDGDGYNDFMAYRSQSTASTGVFYVVYGGSSLQNISVDTLNFQTAANGANYKMAYGDIDDNGTTEIVNVSGFESTQAEKGAFSVYQVNSGELELLHSDTVSTDIIESRADVSSFSTHMGLADLNGNGSQELLFNNYYTGQFFVFELSSNDGEYYKEESLIQNYQGVNTFGIMGDYTNDGSKEVLIAGNQRADVLFVNESSEFTVTPLALDDGDWINFLENPTADLNGAGDVNGDGINDIVIEYSNEESGAYGYRTYFGNEAGNFDQTSEIEYIRSDYQRDSPEFVFNAGDLNNDNIEDYGMVYSSRSDVHIYFGGSFSDNPEADIIIDEPSLSTIYNPVAGDFNGDGITDLLVSKSATENGANDAELNIYFGGSNFDSEAGHTLLYADEYELEDGSIGNVANIGDLNNDGADDIIFASEMERSTTRILFGGESISTTSDLQLPFFSFNFADAGDFNDDGLSDFVVQYSNNMYVHSGFDAENGESFQQEPIAHLTVPEFGANGSTSIYQFLGHSLTSGDFNGDGVSDVAATSVYHENAQTGEGVAAIKIYAGNAEPDTVVDGNIYLMAEDFSNINSNPQVDTLTQNLGTISGVPDQNGDGADELLFATYGFSQTNAAVYYGGELDTMGTSIGVFLEAPNQAIGLGPQANYIYASRGVPAVGDFNNDGRNDYILPQVNDFNFRQSPAYVYSSEEFGVNNEEDPVTAKSFQLHQNYPNPFNPTTEISYNLPTSGEVKLQVFDITGRLVSTIVDQRQTAGVHSINFDASNLASGIYIYRLQASGFSKTRKMTLIK